MSMFNYLYLDMQLDCFNNWVSSLPMQITLGKY